MKPRLGRVNLNIKGLTVNSCSLFLLLPEKVNKTVIWRIVPQIDIENFIMKLLKYVFLNFHVGNFLIKMVDIL